MRGREYEIKLSDEGCELICSGDAPRCMDLITEHRPDVVIMDRKMGSYDGLDVLRGIRGRFPVIPLLLRTAYPCRGQDEAPDAVDFCVTKSFDMQDLKEKIKAAFELVR